jgi:hypothetical protein
MSHATLRLPSHSSRSARPRRRAHRRRGWTIAILVVVLLGGGASWAWWNGSVGPVTIREHCTSVASGRSTELDPEQAGNAAIIASIASQRGLPARAASIGIATAIQESKLRNISYGDRDSLGLFQQRPSQGWGTRAQILDPVYATNAFYDVLAKVDGFENMAITEVAQKVQRSAFPDAYADHEPEARIIASALSGYSPGGFTCVLRQTGTTAQPPGADGLTARAIALRTAAKHETGQQAAVSASADGTWLKYAVAGRGGDSKDVTRASWSLAQWAVARAGNLAVTRVQVGDQQWQRSSSTEGWTTASKAIPAGTVLIAVA